VRDINSPCSKHWESLILGIRSFPDTCCKHSQHSDWR